MPVDPQVTLTQVEKDALAAFLRPLVNGLTVAQSKTLATGCVTWMTTNHKLRLDWPLACKAAGGVIL
jgi:hypothetical protein